MKVAIYCRLSNEDRDKENKLDDSKSIQNQKNMLVAHAVSQGWEIYKIYSDDDYTGADRNRPAFNEMIREAEARKFDIILCKTQSRFTRELEMLEKYIHDLLPRWGIRFVGLVDNADTANKGNKKSRQINGLINEWYLEDLLENIRSVLTSKRKNGEHIGAFAPFGYKKDPKKKGHLIVDDDAAEIVRLIFSLYTKGWGSNKISNYLNERGIPTPAAYKQMNEMNYRCPSSSEKTIWMPLQVRGILKNETYIGNLVQGRKSSESYKTQRTVMVDKEKWICVEGTHEPIIDKDTWDKVQKRLGQYIRPNGNGEVSIFAKKVKCLTCGATMYASLCKNYRYIRCQKGVSIAACGKSQIPEQKLMEVVTAKIREQINQYLDEDLVAAQLRHENETADQLSKISHTKNTYQKKVRECSQAIKTLYLDKSKGTLTERDYLELSSSFNEERDRLESLIAECDRRFTELEARIKEGNNQKDIVRKYADFTVLTRTAVEELIDHIEVGKRAKGEKLPPVKIYWNF